MSVRAVFDRAMEIESPTERSSYLDEACAGNPELRQQVASLLRAHNRAGDFMERPAVEQVEAPPAAPDATVAFDADVKEPQAASRSDRPEATDTRTGPGEQDEETTLEFLQPSTKPGSLGRLAHYEVLEVLGKGGFGIVLKAFDEKLHRIVAVKVMAPHLASASPARKRFLREARASAAIRHENVVAIFAVEDQPIPYLVMEYIAGQTLQERLDSHGPLDLKEVLRTGRQVADGLAAAHAMGSSTATSNRPTSCWRAASITSRSPTSAWPAPPTTPASPSPAWWPARRCTWPPSKRWGNPSITAPTCSAWAACCT